MLVNFARRLETELCRDQARIFADLQYLVCQRHQSASPEPGIGNVLTGRRSARLRPQCYCDRRVNTGTVWGGGVSVDASAGGSDDRVGDGEL